MMVIVSVVGLPHSAWAEIPELELVNGDLQYLAERYGKPIILAIREIISNT